MAQLKDRILESLQQGPQTQKDLMQRLQMSRRRLYDIMQEFMEEGIVARRPSLRDMRQSYYVLRG